jgi:hypothetical protein
MMEKISKWKTFYADIWASWLIGSQDKDEDEVLVQHPQGLWKVMKHEKMSNVRWKRGCIKVSFR